jgi:photosystem II stability/assembly factor-like uncharacterized protein
LKKNNPVIWLSENQFKGLPFVVSLFSCQNSANFHICHFEKPTLRLTFHPSKLYSAMKKYLPFPLLQIFIPLLLSSSVFAQKKSTPPTLTYDSTLYNGLEWRSIGPFRGGRADGVCGVPDAPNTFYAASTGGGVWKTTDAGQNWNNISDGFFGGSIGAVAVSEADPNVVYAGEGEITVRGNVSSGNGIWKSTDAGKTWKFAGLKNSGHIGRIRVHPKDPETVYAAVLGNLWKSSEERGLYRSKDGGKSWQKILYANPDAGACDLLLDPANPRIIYASTWRVRRMPHAMESGGEGSALWKSTDSGDNWTKISDNEGFPKGNLGIIGITVSPLMPERVWAIVEHDKGGIFRSENGGKTWTKINEDRSLRQRAWYYSRIYADPKNVDLLYAVNVNFHRSKDGGKTFEQMPETPHGDHHDLWINPKDPNRMALADDGGMQISTDAGQSWSTYHNQPTAQFYRVITDNSFPFRIYVAQQDNTTLRIRHRTAGMAITEKDWEETAGGESGHIAVDPLDNDIIYGGSYHGYLTRVNHKTGEERSVNVVPDNTMGYGAEGAKHRFQWNFPLFYSPHNPKKLYAASNYLHVTTNEGQSWETISPDLTRNDKSRQTASGGPITKDNTGVEYYCTIFAALESPLEKDLIWTGSDDGLIQLSKDGGKTWTNVTPPKNVLPDWTMINSLETHPTMKGGLYVAATAYKSGDYKPYLLRTLDYGKTWTKITNGIGNEHFTRVVRADPVRAGLLYAGTEQGMYVSFDDGANWQRFQMNLPKVPVTDLAVKENTLIAATQGRSVWMIDDLTPLHQLTPQTASQGFKLFAPPPSYRYGIQVPDWVPVPKNAGKNHHNGVGIHFFVPGKPDTTQLASLEILDNSGKTIRKFLTKTDKKEDKFMLRQGMNRFVWNMRYPDATKFEGLILWGGGLEGPKVVPGMYKAKLTYNNKTEEVPFEIKGNPLAKATAADYQAQSEFLQEVRNKLSETHEAVKTIREVRKSINSVTERTKNEEDKKELQQAAKAIDEKMTKIEETLYQTKNRSNQDPLNYPIRLNNKLSSVGSDMAGGDFRPTDQAVTFKNETIRQIDEQLSQLKQILNTDIPAFNDKVRNKNIPAVSLPEKPVGQ